MFDADKTRMIELPYDEKNYDNMWSRFHPIPERNGRTDGRTYRLAILISRVSMLTRDKNLSVSVLFSLGIVCLPAWLISHLYEPSEELQGEAK